MKSKTIANALLIGFGSVLGLAVSLLIGIIVYENYYGHKFEAMATGLTARRVKNEWGEPDRYLDGATDRVVMAYDNSILGSYLFIMDKDSTVTQKYFDD